MPLVFALHSFPRQNSTICHFYEQDVLRFTTSLFRKNTVMMNRRNFAALGATALAATAMSGPAFAQQSTSGKPTSKMSHDYFEACARACSDCQRACDMCSTHCAGLLSQGKKKHAVTLATCQDCADICATAAQIVSRGGPFAALVCKSCADACDRCGEECEKFPDDKHMKMCAEECRKCETACREMVKHVGQV